MKSTIEIDDRLINIIKQLEALLPDEQNETSKCETSYGDKFWRNSNGQLHREDGPAIEYADGDKRWYLNNKNYETRELYLEALAEFYKEKCK